MQVKLESLSTRYHRHLRWLLAAAVVCWVALGPEREAKANVCYWIETTTCEGSTSSTANNIYLNVHGSSGWSGALNLIGYQVSSGTPFQAGQTDLFIAENKPDSGLTDYFNLWNAGNNVQGDDWKLCRMVVELRDGSCGPADVLETAIYDRDPDGVVIHGHPGPTFADWFDS